MKKIVILFTLLFGLIASAQTPTFSFSADKIQDTFFGCTFGDSLDVVLAKTGAEKDTLKKFVTIHNRHFGSIDWNAVIFGFDNKERFCLALFIKQDSDKNEIKLAFSSVSSSLGLKYGDKKRFLSSSTDNSCIYLNANMDGKGVILMNEGNRLFLFYGDLNGFADLAGIQDY